MGKEIDVFTGENLLSIMLVVLLISSFAIGYYFGQGQTNMCDLDNDDIDNIKQLIDTGFFRYLNNATTVEQAIEMYQVFSPISEVIAESFITQVCK